MTVALGLTTKVIVCVLVQVPLSPSTVYVVVVVGETTAVVPVTVPGFHVYDVAPFAVNVAELPTHIVFDEAVRVIFGVARLIVIV